METHSSLRYCPSCGMISEGLISRWGASVRSRYELQEFSDYGVFEPVYNNRFCSSSWADLSFSSCPSSAVVLITHLQTNPTLILSKCKATPLGINVLSNLLFFLLGANLTPKFSFAYSARNGCTHSGPPGPLLSGKGWTETRAPRYRCRQHHRPICPLSTAGCFWRWRIFLLSSHVWRLQRVSEVRERVNPDYEKIYKFP